ncbi:hypothetical protein HCX49_19675 [Sphingobacterium kitahiroshimense]|uniref:hypothetical protein n=1 Tax=Sphingobacterium sp. B16(2022) TaxID=2914044 RepID=UPI00143C3E85|nr:hypothetical protein [Sphingobacterium sp. B16(2022)]NJI75430.1 hypothetical protein [Sphingobacterium sp. B16(2022)]
MKKLILLLVFVASLTTTLAQSTTYQFVYYKTGTNAKPIYYFSDLFTSSDWSSNKDEIRSKFKSLLAEEGVEVNSLLIQEGLKGANSADSKFKANAFKETLIKLDKDKFERNQSQYPANKREVFSPSKNTINLYR